MNQWVPVIAYRPGMKHVLTVPAWAGCRHTAAWLIRHLWALKAVLWCLNRLPGSASGEHG
jgi:hypothetical protein